MNDNNMNALLLIGLLGFFFFVGFMVGRDNK